jgi:hypothetical protein
MEPPDTNADLPKRPVNPAAKKSRPKRHSGNMRDDSSPLKAVHEAFAPFFLWLAQILSILGCLLSITYPIYVFLQLNKAELAGGLTPLWYAAIGGSSICGFIYSYAMAVVFSRTRASHKDSAARKTKRIV